MLRRKFFNSISKGEFEYEYWTLVDLNVQGDDRQDYRLRKRHKVGSLIKLDPLIDGLMRIGCRLQRSN